MTTLNAERHYRFFVMAQLDLPSPKRSSGFVQAGQAIHRGASPMETWMARLKRAMTMGE